MNYNNVEYNNQGKPLSYYIKNFLLVFLFIIIIIFLLLWLLPNKATINPISDQIFQSNLNNMKDVATSYYTKDRLPEDEDESKKITLKEMLDMKLLMNVTDKNGKTCDTTNSYAEITKLENEYKLKINLKCGNVEDYIVTYLGCYNYCSDNSICEKQRTNTNSDDDYNETEAEEEARHNVGGVAKEISNNTGSYNYNYSYNTKSKKVAKAKKKAKKVKKAKATKKNKTVNITKSKTINITKIIVNKITNVTVVIIPDNPTPTPTPTEHSCEIIDGTYYDKDGHVVTPSEYEASCTEPEPHYCEIVDGKYYDKNGNVVNGDEYEESCVEKPEPHYCEVVDGKYYDKDGNVTSKSDYEASCTEPEPHYCEIVDGNYYDKDGNIVSGDDYEASCNPETDKYRYQYEKTDQVCYDKQYSEWSDWSENKEYDPEDNDISWGQNEYTWYEKNGHKTTTYYEYTEDRTQPIYNISYDKLLGYKTQYACDGYTYFMDSETTTVYTTTKSATGWVYKETITTKKVPESTLTKKYEVVGIDYEKCNATCTKNPVYTVKVYTRTIQTATDKVSSNKNSLRAVCNFSETQIPIYGKNVTFAGYVTDRELVEENTYYYHEKTRTLIKDAYCTYETLYVWSYSDNDTSLISQGYVYNGKKEKINN